MIDRGGQILTTGTIGRLKVLRQQIVRPGETLDCRVGGEVTMESLRERDALRINAHIAAFMQPVRWLEPNWTDIVKEGRHTAKNVAYHLAQPNALGLGGDEVRMVQSYWQKSVLRIYNEWYKWPEDDDLTDFTGADHLGPICTNLEHSWTRTRDQSMPADAADIDVAAASSTMSVVDLAETQAAFRNAIQREVLSYDRYMEILREIYGADGSREVDQVPILLEQDQVGLNPRSIPATDGASLGQWQSLYDFNVDFSFELTAPEHMILTYVLVVRFAPITEEVHPLANNRLTWEELVGDPGMLSALPPTIVDTRDVFDTNTSQDLGYLPAGWQWRAQNNIIGNQIDARDSFPVMNQPTTLAECRDASRRVNAFRSSSLGDYRVDLHASERSQSAMPNALSSHYVGMKDAGKGDGSPYPKQGKLK